MLRFLFVGDCVIREEGNIQTTEEIARLFESHDYNCCNFEGPIKTDSKPYPKIGPIVRQIPSSVDALKNLGFNIACLANNHIYDGGFAELEKTESELKKNGFLTLGVGGTEAAAYAPLLIEKNGEKIAVINAAENGFGCVKMLRNKGYAWILSPIVKEKIRELRNAGYFVIVVSHAGCERCNYPLPEWKTAYREFIDIGANLVIAHHPHVVQGWETYKSGRIYFSLGNFIWQNGRSVGFNTIAVSIGIEKGRIAESKTHYTRYENGRLSLCDDDNFISAVAEYCAVAQDDKKLEEIVDQKIYELLADVYPRYYYTAATGLYSGPGILLKIKSAIKFCLLGMRRNDRLTYHNLAIETHNWAYRRILELLIKTNEKDGY